MDGIITREKAIKDLAKKWTVAEHLRIQYPTLKYLLKGEFNAKEFNFYPQAGGALVSRELDQGREKNPTVGLIYPGECHFPLEEGNRETIIVLEGGVLRAWANNRLESLLSGPNGSFTLDPGNTLNLINSNSTDLIAYICRYEKVEEFVRQARAEKQ